MRSRQLRTLVVSLILAFTFSSFSVAAAPRERDRWFDRDFSFARKVVKHIKKTLGVGTQGDTLTLPTP
ncbi:MAG: hypothetical protein M3P06_11700 [Acidobacteriota bacterium]|nr:hypothetical protein [Acidobacteriota bacterium]